jgi:hypothetical protein
MLAAALMLSGCSRGSGYAERIDVPLHLEISPAATAQHDCGRKSCDISYLAFVTDAGTEPAYARHCTVRALDSSGELILEAPVAIGFPAGGYVEPEQPYRQTGSLGLTLSPRHRARVASLTGSCFAYEWHGTPSI